MATAFDLRSYNKHNLGASICTQHKTSLIYMSKKRIFLYTYCQRGVSFSLWLWQGYCKTLLIKNNICFYQQTSEQTPNGKAKHAVIEAMFAMKYSGDNSRMNTVPNTRKKPDFPATDAIGVVFFTPHTKRQRSITFNSNFTLVFLHQIRLTFNSLGKCYRWYQSIEALFQYWLIKRIKLFYFISNETNEEI